MLTPPLYPPGTFIPEAVQLPQPKFGASDPTRRIQNQQASAGKEVGSDGSGSTAVASEVLYDADSATESIRQELQERLEDLRTLQKESLTLYCRYATALNALQRQAPANSDASIILGTQPACSWTNQQTSQVAAPHLPKTRAAVTLVVKELPAYYTQDLFLSEMIAGGFEGCFDFLYIPYNFNRSSNLGYAIVNFILPQHAMRFQQCLQGATLDEEMKRTGRKLLIELAPMQGYEANCRASLEWTGNPPLRWWQLRRSDRDANTLHHSYVL